MSMTWLQILNRQARRMGIRSSNLHRSQSAIGRPPAGTPNPSSGFTLIELLISALIAGLIVSGLLGIVVELVSTNRRELARSETMRDMGIATEFMSNELREAVYVYTGKCLWEGNNEASNPERYCPGLFSKGYLKAPEKSLPLVAFWKLDPVPENCEDPKLCDKYKLSGRTYTLVVYFLSRDNPDKKWEGRARITRAELAQFNADGQENKQYVNPREDNVTLQTWPETFDGATPKTVAIEFGSQSVPAPVLVDYVDDTKDSAGQESVKCPPAYDKTPSDKSLTEAKGDFAGVRSVYGCVRDELFKSTTELSVTNQTLNQKVILTVRGNPEGRYGLDKRGCSQEELEKTAGSANQQSTCRLAAVKTEVLNRGTINKEPTTFPELQK